MVEFVRRRALNKDIECGLVLEPRFRSTVKQAALVIAARLKAESPIRYRELIAVAILANG